MLALFWMLVPRHHKAHPVAEDEAHKLWYFIDVIFPLPGLAIVALMSSARPPTRTRRFPRCSLAEIQPQ